MGRKFAVPTGFSIETLDPKIHDRGQFSCGHADIDNFLATQATQAQERGLSKTHVLVEVETQPLKPVVGYVTLAPKIMPLTECGPAFRKKTGGMDFIQGQIIARVGVQTA